MLRHFLESGVQMEKGRHEVFSGEWGSQWRSRAIVRRLGFKWRMGFIILANKMSGFKCSDPGSFARRKISGFKKTKKEKIFGVQENQKEIIIPSGCVVFRPWLSLCYHLFWYPGRRFCFGDQADFLRTRRILLRDCVSSPILTGVVNYFPIRVQIVRLFLVFNHSSS